MSLFAGFLSSGPGPRGGQKPPEALAEDREPHDTRYRQQAPQGREPHPLAGLRHDDWTLPGGEWQDVLMRRVLRAAAALNVRDVVHLDARDGE